MKNTPARCFAALATIVLLSFTVSPAGASEADLPDGIAVTIGEDGRNEVFVTVGGELLAVDVGSGPLEGESRIQFAIYTGAVGQNAVPSAIELVPDARVARGGTPAANTTITVQSGFTLGDGERQVVILGVGRRATAADAVVWIPSDRTLITGRLCDRTGVAALAESDTITWMRELGNLLDLEPDVVIPGRGAPGGAELLSGELERLTGLRSDIEEGLLGGLTADEAADAFNADWFTAWNEKAPKEAFGAYRAVFNEIGGLVPPWELMEERKLREGPSPTHGDEGWTKPKKVLWRNYWPESLAMLTSVAPGVNIVPYDTQEEALAQIADADALIGTASAELLAAGKSLRWVQVGSAGVESLMTIAEFRDGSVLLSNGQRMASAMIGEHVMALTRSLTRGINRAVAAQTEGKWKRSEIGNSAPLTGLRGKTMLVVGLGGIGTEVARLADGAGMRVTAIRNSRRVGPPFVDKVGLGEDLAAYVEEADVVVNCLPMTPDTEDTFDDELFAIMKPTAFFINVGRGGTVDTDALVAALENGDIAGAGLDVTDPEPLPDGHPLWKAPNLVITPHFAAWSDEGRERRWLLYRENLRRFVAGERLLSVVDPTRGY